MARVLIAEDEEALRALTARALTDAGHEVTTAVDGAEALDIITREGGRFDLLLTDYQDAADGRIALALSVARDFPDIIILLMTAYADQRERASNLDALIHNVILKPFPLVRDQDGSGRRAGVKARRSDDIDVPLIPAAGTSTQSNKNKTGFPLSRE